MSLHYNGEESYLFINKTEICKSKGISKFDIYQFWLMYQTFLQKIYVKKIVYGIIVYAFVIVNI